MKLERMSTKIKYSKQYQKKDPIEHCLERYDMYVGSTRMRNVKTYVAELDDDNHYCICQATIKTSPAILRIFVEAISNAIDNAERSRHTQTPCSKIKVCIDEITGETSVWNDGDIVPIEKNETEGCYNHSLIFGQLLTGSNLDDSVDRDISGRNGIGIKLTNIFSLSFTVEGFDPTNKKKFKQTWTNNMRDTCKPKVRTCKNLKGYTKVSWVPDFKQFNIKKYSPDIVKLYTRYVIDAAMVSNVSVYLNDKLIPVKNISQYAALYGNPTNEKLVIKTKTSTVVVTPSTSGHEIISFVNGVYTRLGGQHVDAWSEAIFRPIVEKFNKKGKKGKIPKINIADVKQFFRLIIVVRVIRPEFDGQEKNKLESPVVMTEVTNSQINSIFKWSVIDKIEEIIRDKEMIILKKTERKRRNVKIDGLDPANNAGGKFATDCSLFVCEGLSAKTYVVAGINTGVYGKSGRDWFGILPITGKVLNVRNAPPTSIASNNVISSFIQATGLRHGMDYTIEDNFKTLRYGRIIMIADADVDGIHIEGLIMNVIHALFPTILNRSQPYLVSMKTPIVRVFTSKRKDLLFYDENRFNQYLAEQQGKLNVKYYKGLGTTREEDVPDTFGLKMVEYKTDENAYDNMNKVFNKKHADKRKIWLGEYNPANNVSSLDDKDAVSEASLSEFLNNEMIKFSHADCARSIPSGVDGLKESQRKILYAVRKRNLKFTGKSLKVAQLSGYTAEHSNYHHGEQNLQDTIVGMASGYTGSNNIPLLYPDGGFGTRLEGGKDAASARYIYTKLEGLTSYIFRVEDDPLLVQVNDDGDKVQPEYYMPIIPMILVNGCAAGIGTGWSCTVPCFNPIDIIKCITVWLEHEKDPLRITKIPNITPWYRGFKGEILSKNNGRFTTTGVVETPKKNTKIITELPIGFWTNKFKDYCIDLVSNKQIKSFKNYSTTQHVHFSIKEHSDGLSCNVDNLKLKTYLSTTNMVLFDENNKLKKYKNTNEIIDDFCTTRLRFYQLRKQHQVRALKIEIKYLTTKKRFIQDIIANDLIIMNKKEAAIVDELKRRDYHLKDGSYEYLLRLQVRTFTSEKIKQLNRDTRTMTEKLNKLMAISAKNIWLYELNDFKTHYNSWLKDMEKRVPSKS